MAERDTVPVIIRLRLPDGRIFDCHEDCLREYANNQVGWWTWGNGACDCNRSLSLNRAHGLGLSEPDPINGLDEDDTCWNCGNRIELLALSVDGVRVYRAPCEKCGTELVDDAGSIGYCSKCRTVQALVD